MLALRDASTGQFIDACFGLDEDNEWYEEDHSTEFASVYELAADNDDGFEPFDEDLDDTFWSSLLLGSDYDWDDALCSQADIEQWVHARYNDVIKHNDVFGFQPPQKEDATIPADRRDNRHRSREKEVNLFCRWLRRYKTRGFGQQRAPKWQQRHRTRADARYGIRQQQMRLSDWYLGADRSF